MAFRMAGAGALGLVRLLLFGGFRHRPEPSFRGLVMKTICVYCGSSPGTDPLYLEAAAHLGDLLAKKAMTLVYGGGRLGLMGRLADTVLAGGAKVIGVIPESLRQKELA